MSTDLYPIALLMDELRHDDVASRVQSMNRLDTIAIALGPIRTREELLPFLEDVIPEDEDEVIAIAASKLKDFIPFIGGVQFANLLLPLLEKISACEEPIVRDNAVDSLNNISLQLSIDQIMENFIPLIIRLSKERWFSLHIAATGLFYTVLPRLNDSIEDEFNLKIQLVQLYYDLITDDSPMVRKAAASNLPKIISSLNEPINEQVWNLFLQMYKSLINDNQDSVKFLSIDVLIEILSYYNKLNNSTEDTTNTTSTTDSINELFDSLISIISDPSWRVRYMIADKFNLLSDNFNNDSFTLKLLPHFISLLKDNESEVRKAISKQLPEFSSKINLINPSLLIEQILPIVNQLSNDESENVRAALASKISNLSPILGKERTIDFLLPIFIEMLKDEFSDVRLNIISNLEIVNNVIGIELLNESLMPAITSLSNDKLWRVRLAIIEQIPLLAQQLGISFFDKSLGQLCMDWLWDPVYSIRNAAVENLSILCKLFGNEWSKNQVIDKILQKKETQEFNNFICRITCLFTFVKLIDIVNNELVENYIYPFITDLINDNVPNIRFNVAKSMFKFANHFKENNQLNIINNEIIPILENLLNNDEDDDVRYFANENLTKINSL